MQYPVDRTQKKWVSGIFALEFKLRIFESIFYPVAATKFPE